MSAHVANYEGLCVPYTRLISDAKIMGVGEFIYMTLGLCLSLLSDYGSASLGKMRRGSWWIVLCACLLPGPE
jgi:hypothetical protein